MSRLENKLVCSKLAALQAILPKDPDEQKNYLYQTIKKEMVPVNKSDVERIVYYLTEVKLSLFIALIPLTVILGY